MHTSSLFVRALGVSAALLVPVETSVPLGAQQVTPPAPVNLTSVVNGSTVTLTWLAGAGDGAPTGYRIEVGSVQGASNLLVAQTTATSAVATAVPGGRYFVRVRALIGQVASGPSNEIAVVVSCAGAPPPTGLIGGVHGELVTLTWGTVPGAAGYQVEAGSASGLANLAVLSAAAPGVATVAPPGTYYVRVRAVNACGAGAPSNEVVVNVGGSPPAAGPIWGVVDPSSLGTCGQAVHDQYVVDGGDGYRYRTWHAQTDSSGCVFAHEHGDDPNAQTNAHIRAQRVRFGYIGRRHPMPGEPAGHEEPHEGFKVFVANQGQRNEESRFHLHDSRIVFHMGTGGPRRFATQHHSMEYATITNDGRYMLLQTMADTGGVANICTEPRAGKTVVALNPSCRLGSLYEIWANKIAIHSGGQVVAAVTASTAVFDPITALDPSNPSRLLYLWDPVMDSVLEFPHNDRRGNRGCDREAYHGPSYWYNLTDRTVFYTDAMGNELPAGDPLALSQIVSRHNTNGRFFASVDGNETFKLRNSHCGQRAQLGLKN